MGAMGSQITGVSRVYSIVCLGADQRNIKAPRHWPWWGEIITDRWIPSTKGQSRGNISIGWRHHGFVPILAWSGPSRNDGLKFQCDFIYAHDRTITAYVCKLFSVYLNVVGNSKNVLVIYTYRELLEIIFPKTFTNHQNLYNIYNHILMQTKCHDKIKLISNVYLEGFFILKVV